MFAGRLAGSGAHVMGRVTYLEMAESWPKSSHVIAAPMNDIPKVVFSRTLREDGASWPDTRIVRGDTADEIGRLKAEPGGEIIAHGGTRFVRSLVRLGLVDRFRFYVVPFAAGTGRAAVHRGRAPRPAAPGAEHCLPRRDPRTRLRPGVTRRAER
ncbi:dihydrofolate reductase family protein [Streptomyces asiaticus]